jgi:hypothetical protein
MSTRCGIPQRSDGLGSPPLPGPPDYPRVPQTQRWFLSQKEHHSRRPTQRILYTRRGWNTPELRQHCKVGGSPSSTPSVPAAPPTSYRRWLLPSTSSWQRPRGAAAPELPAGHVRSAGAEHERMSSKMDEERKRLTTWPTGAADQPNDTNAIDLPARHVAQDVRTHELASNKWLHKGPTCSSNYCPCTARGQCPHAFGRTTDHIPTPVDRRKPPDEAKKFKKSRPWSCRQHNPRP